MPQPQLARSVFRRSWKAALAGTVLVSGMTAASAQVTVGPPEFTGRWSVPFEEGGLDTPACWEADGGRLECKPVAQAMGMLPDGRVFYYSGLEGQENSAPGPSSGDMRDSPSRLLDLRTGTPQWTTPTTPTGGAVNPDSGAGVAGRDPDAVAGLAGIPGRPGDGLVGSTWGRAGGPETAPTAAPDDPEANDGDMFCGDIASLGDGRLLIMGGGDWYNEPGVPAGENTPGLGLPEVEGLRSARIFDPLTSTFTQTGNMKYHRWYPGSVTLPDGKVLVAGGATKRIKNTQASHVRRTETFDPATGQFTENYAGPASENSLPLSPRLHLLPDGKVLYAAAGQNWAPFGAAADEALYGMLQLYDPRTSTWEVRSPHLLGMRDGAASVLMPLDPPYDRATVLTFGGSLGPSPGGEAGVPLSTLLRIDGTTGKMSEKLTRFSMLESRWNPSAVGLPDGTVLAVGGATTSDTTAPGTGLPVRTVELFDIRTEAWYGMARISRDRTYHHAAVLLPDGRVLLGGHAPPASPARGGDLGRPFPNNERDPSFEIFTPHYLFRGERPIIRHVQAGIRWGETFELETRQALSTDSVVLIRLGSPQHIIDSDQRTVRLDYTRRSGRLAVKAPPNGAIAPPGYYYLFLNLQTRRGPIPSMARVVRIGTESDFSEATQPFPDLGRSVDDPGAANTDGDSSPGAALTGQVSKLLGTKMATGQPTGRDPSSAGAAPLVASAMPRRPAFL